MTEVVDSAIADELTRWRAAARHFSTQGQETASIECLGDCFLSIDFHRQLPGSTIAKIISYAARNARMAMSRRLMQNRCYHLLLPTKLPRSRSVGDEGYGGPVSASW